MKNEKKHVLAIILLIILILILTFFIATLLYNKYYANLRPSNTQNNKETKKEEKTVENTSKYNNFTEKEIKGVSNNLQGSNLKDLTLKIVDGKLTAKLDEKDITVKGLEGNIRSFVYNRIGCSPETIEHIIVAINDKNELFSTNVDGYDRDDYITFKKANITEEVVDITELGFSIYFTTCSYIDIAAVLKDNTVKLFEGDFTHDLTISDRDVTNFRYSTYTYMVYSDNTIGKLDMDGNYGKEFDERLKYNNEVLKISKLYSISKPESDMNFISYAISNNNLYKLQAKVDFKQNKVTNSSVTLVNNSKVKNELVEDTNSEYKYKNITITFEDGTTHTINDVSSVYNAK